MTRAGTVAAAAAGLLALTGCPGAPETGPRPGLRVLGAAPLVVGEAGGTATFQVALATEPAADVEVDVLADDASEGLVTGPAGGAAGAWLRLRFTPSDWSAAQAVTVSGVDDAARDGDVAWHVGVRVAASADAAYAGAAAESIGVVTRDDDTPAIRLGRTTLFTAEAGQVTDAFEVALGSQPSGVVTVPVTSDDPSEGLVTGGPHAISPAGAVDLVFTPSDWSTPQAVTVWGLSDHRADGTQVYTVTVGPATGDPDYAALPVQEVTVANAEGDAVGLSVESPDGTSVQEGAALRLVVSLATIPAEDVVVRASSSDLAQAALEAPAGAQLEPDGSVALSFAAGSWPAQQELWVRGVPDFAVDGPRVVPIAFGPPTGDPAYAGLPAASVDVTVLDVDRPADVVLSTDSLVVAEGYAVGFSFWLSTAPREPVWVRFASPDPSQLTLDPVFADATDGEAVTYRFDSTTWSQPRWGAVHAPADGVVTGARTVPVIVGPPAGDPRFAALPAKTLEVSIFDSERPGIVVATGSTVGALAEGSTRSVPISLAAAPLADVVVPVSSGAPSEALVSAGGPPSPSLELTFTPSSWNEPQVVTVSAVDDAILEPDPPHPFSISVGPTGSASSAYDGVAGRTLWGTVVDDEAYASEGTLDAPLDVATLLPFAGEVGPSATSTYRLAGFPDGGVVRVKGAADRISFAVLSDDPAHATLCAPRDPALDAWCAVRLPPGGSFLVAVDGSASRRGATFTLDAAPFTLAADVPLEIPDDVYPGAVSRIALGEAPSDAVALAVLVEIAHPRAADLELWLTPPSGNTTYQIVRCSAATGADFDRTVLANDARVPYVCTAGAPWAGTFRSTIWPPLDPATAGGTWTFEARDRMSGDAGTLVQWGIAVR